MLAANSEQPALSKSNVKQKVLRPLGQRMITVGC